MSKAETLRMQLPVEQKVVKEVKKVALIPRRTGTRDWFSMWCCGRIFKRLVDCIPKSKPTNSDS